MIRKARYLLPLAVVVALAGSCGGKQLSRERASGGEAGEGVGATGDGGESDAGRGTTMTGGASGEAGMSTGGASAGRGGSSSGGGEGGDGGADDAGGQSSGGAAGVGGMAATAGSGGMSGGMGGSSGRGGDGGKGGRPPLTDDPQSGPDTMGWIGCVSGENTAAGYRRVGGTRMWGPYGNAGGVVQGWINNQSSHWQRFDQQVQMYGPPRAVWIQICVFSPGATIDEVRRVVENTRSRAPDAYLYISGLPLYSAGHMCSLWGPDGPELTDALALQMAMEDPDVHYTGRLGPLGPEDLADECHPNPAGEEELGWQVRLIWGQP